VRIGNSNVVIATHVYAPGPAQELLKYLLQHKTTNKILFIGHPLFYSEKLKGDGFEVYSNSSKIEEKYLSIRKRPEIISYLYAFISNIIYVFKQGTKFELYVGCNNLNALSGLVLKKLGRVRKCVYYVVDYNPVRFTNPILNGIFQYIDKLCALYCDETWNLSARMITARFGKKYPKNQKVVPMGCWFGEIKRIPFDKCEKHTVVFMGHLLEKQGVQLLISAIPEVIKHIKDFKVRIIGDGPYRKYLEKLIFDLGVSKHVEMLGYIDSEEEKYKLISSASLAYALYDPDIASFTYYADPGKIKTYLSCGVPVLVTNVPEISKELVATNSGVILPYDVSGLVSFFKDIFVSDKKLKILRDNAIFMGKKYDFEKIYAKALLILNISSK